MITGSTSALTNAGLLKISSDQPKKSVWVTGGSVDVETGSVTGVTLACVSAIYNDKVLKS
ncbi:MAG: hypothetical protein WCG98_01405 [bacterium]